MAVPKRKKSKSKRDMRRAHTKATPVDVTSCPQCGEVKLHHRACPACGVYKGRTVMAVQD
ncbi:MAG: 50S ribosomal protein L32 [Desulfosudaceae bacterium]